MSNVSIHPVTMKILLVEDTRTDAILVRTILDRLGISVEWAQTLQAALQLLDEFKPDAILSDLHLEEGVSSEEIFERLRSKAPETALVAYSGSPPREALEPVDAFFPKNGMNGVSLSFVLRKAMEQRGEISRLRGLARESVIQETGTEKAP